MAKIHDFGAEINGLYHQGGEAWRRREMPRAYWSRKAKNDVIMWTLKTDSLGGLMNIPFFPFEELFLAGDGFVNPLVHAPHDWLYLPYSHLMHPPERVTITGNVNPRNHWSARREDEGSWRWAAVFAEADVNKAVSITGSSGDDGPIGAARLWRRPVKWRRLRRRYRLPLVAEEP